MVTEHAASAADAVEFWDTYQGHPYALPDAVVLEPSEIAAIRATARDAWRIYARAGPLLRALPDEGLAALGIPAPAFDVVRQFDRRAGETLVGRFDLLRDGDAYRVVELNAETPFFVVESFAESGARARAAGLRDPNTGERERLGAAIAAALAPPRRGARIGVLASNVYREDAGTACFLRELISEHTGAETVFVPVHELAVVDGLVGDAGAPLDALYRCYPLELLAGDRDAFLLFEAVARGACRLLNPPSALLLQSKAAQALIWGLYERGEFFDAEEREIVARVFLPTYLDRPDDGAAYVRKPVLGREGIGVTVIDAAGAEIAHGEREPQGYGEQPAVYQRFVRATRRTVRRADGALVDAEELFTCFIAAGEPSAVGLRLGGKVIDAWGYFAPVGVRG